MKNRLLEYSILRGKSEESDEKLEGKIGPVMEVHMDANAALSQLSYEPEFLICRGTAQEHLPPAAPGASRGGTCYYTIISSIVKTVFFRKMKIFCCQFADDIVK